MMKPIRLSVLEDNISYHFQDKELLLLAMTHSSYSNEQKNKDRQNNERLEFLGDAVLEITVSDYLFRKYPDYDEGKMTKTRSSMVCEFTLASCARDIHLGEYLLLSHGEDSTGGRERDSILSDAFEALIGAIYVDGGMEMASRFIHGYLLDDIGDRTLFYDAKTILQEMVQASEEGNLRYQLIRESGPDHNKEFTVETYIGNKAYAQGKGRTKKSAEQMAAYRTLLMLKKQ